MSTETSAEIVATCEAALTYLTEQGWTKDVYLDKDGESACLAGAVVIAAVGKRSLVDQDVRFSGALVCPAVRAVAATIAEVFGGRVHCDLGPRYTAATVYAFNDHSETTREDVIDVVQKTIKRHTDERVETP